MKNSMFLGLAIGMAVGACVATNCQKTRQMVTNAQGQLINKLCPQQNDAQSQTNSQNEQQ